MTTLIEKGALKRLFYLLAPVSLGVSWRSGHHYGDNDAPRHYYILG